MIIRLARRCFLDLRPESLRLDQLGVVPGTSLYFQGVRIRKTHH
jgi:hypothetical protein